MSNLSNFIAGIFLFFASLFGYQQPTQTPITLGAVYPVGGTTFYLSGSGVTSSQSTIQLTSFQTPDGRNLTMSMFGTIGYGALEPGSSKLEDITFTGITQNANGTATLTGVTRGNDFVTPYAASTTLAKAHAGGVPFILSNTPGFYTQFLSANNTATSSATLVFASTTPPRYDFPSTQASGSYISTTSELASVAYVNAVALASAPNSSETVKGVSQLATGAQAQAGTSLGSTGARLVIPASLCSNTSSANILCVITDSAGKIAQGFLDLTANWTFTGAINIAASVSKNLTLNTLAYVFPTSQSANTVLTNDGSGTLSWSAITETLLTSTTTQQDMAFATTTTFTAYKYLRLEVYFAGQTTGAGAIAMDFNSDFGANYGSQSSLFTTTASYSSDPQNVYSSLSLATATTSPMYFNARIYNASATPKLTDFSVMSGKLAGPTVSAKGSAVWNNTSSQITQIIFRVPSGGAISSGTIINVYGHN